MSTKNILLLTKVNPKKKINFMDTFSFETLNNVAIINNIISLMLGITLSAACGFRVFVPFLILSAVGVFSGFSLPSGFEWLETNQALLMFAIASGLEVLAYYIPWLDNLLDTLATPLAATAGTVITGASISEDMNPLIQWTLAVIAGGGSAGLIKGFTTIFRATSTATTGGLTNPILSTVELIFAAFLSIAALTLPVIAGFCVIILLLFVSWKLIQFFMGKKQVNPNQLS